MKHNRDEQVTYYQSGIGTYDKGGLKNVSLSVLRPCRLAHTVGHRAVRSNLLVPLLDAQIPSASICSYGTFTNDTHNLGIRSCDGYGCG